MIEPGDRGESFSSYLTFPQSELFYASNRCFQLCLESFPLLIYNVLLAVVVLLGDSASFDGDGYLQFPATLMRGPRYDYRTLVRATQNKAQPTSQSLLSVNSFRV